MKVSVIIAVYNAEKFIEKAVTSALEQQETGEVILVDDLSQDDSWSVCKKLALTDKRIKLVENIEGVNNGEGGARNKGFKFTTFDRIAFLDADDYYLPGRFTTAMKLLDEDSVDGVYEAVGTTAWDAISLERHLKRLSNSMGKADPMLTTMDFACKPSELFEALCSGKHGFFHFNGLTLKRSVFVKAPLIDPLSPLPGVGNDSNFFYRLAANVNLYPGRLNEAVAIRNIYDGNTTLSIFTSEEHRKKVTYYQYIHNKALLNMVLQRKYSKETNRTILRRRLEYYNEYYIKQSSYLYRKLLKIINLFKCLNQNPGLIYKVL